ncbi:DUF7511 domain-containing protein [Natrialba taiwanensis]|uniref:DUF7511 domain-containing protein n=1 Tax=Natrialba taiwanensis DSM 12281 TaxID=1230458 RepID=L9ZFJ4_9EURY|nr:hypothetical protein [Natrialba taiwanensis]ELY85099.1 hypothetical protein C484_21087 [Natrialba taiwanensis DSM 12281]
MTAEFTAADDHGPPNPDESEPELEFRTDETGAVTVVPADATALEREEAWLTVSSDLCCELGAWR